MGRHELGVAPRKGFERRGVLLLVVLSMLTLFLLLGTTFLVLASRARSVSKAYLQLAGQQQRSTESLRPMIRDAAFQVMRGTEKRSAMKFHDLLGDRYSGSDRYEVAAASPISGSQLLKIVVTPIDGAPSPTVSLAGRVLGFVDGPAGVAGSACRIVDADTTSVTVPWPVGLNGQAVQSLQTVRINKPDFNGMGVTRTDELVPNWSLVATVSPSSLDEDYDAVDLQNIALAEADQSVASYCRPGLIDEWIQWYFTEKNNLNPGALNDTTAAEKEIYAVILNGGPLATDADEAAIELEIIKQLRRATLRPFPLDHSYVENTDFTGKSWDNPTTFFNLLRNAAGFDVDNDKDGTLDSVWIDFGREVFRLPDGTSVKPLAAIRCIDLGGRLNLNAHGSLAHLLGSQPNNDSMLLRDPTRGAADAVPGDRGLASDQPMGLGFGPADVRLDGLLSPAQMEAILLGRVGGTFFHSGERIYRKLRNMNGRYGGGVTSVENPALPGGVAGSQMAGVIRPWLGQLTSDYWGRSVMGLNHYGHPETLPWLSVINDAVNSPYELDLTTVRDSSPYVSLTGAVSGEDEPYTISELEACLRRRDADGAALLPQRLLSITLEGDPSIYQKITTESWDTPAIIGNPPSLPTGESENLEIRRGLRMNLNRPFGDGLDNDNDGTVDEPDETADSFAIAVDAAELNPNDRDAGSGWNLTRGATIRALPEVDPDGNRYPDAQPGLNVAGMRVRQIMADNLYHLMRAIRGSALLSQISDRDLAQWSINVVDFLDSDAIMTPYKYASGVPGQHVVWGCEHPDVIITETVAFHDRAIADTNEDDGPDDNTDEGSGKKTTDGSSPRSDEDFDQIRVPQGSLFIELHAVRNKHAQSLPLELYDGAQGTWELDLGRVPSGGRDPVWRLSITRLRQQGALTDEDPFRALHRNSLYQFDPADADGFTMPYGMTTDRYVWFTATPPPAYESGKQKKPNLYNTFRPSGDVTLKCGEYLVAGPRSTTWLGGAPAGFGQKSDQKIDLPPNGRTFSADGPPWASIGLNLSERFGWDYYPTPPGTGTGAAATRLYGPLVDPAAKYPDVPGDVGGPLEAAGLEQGTHLNVATVVVERLADPTRPFNPDADSMDWNPYIVVDFMPVDLNVFNGETASDDPSVAGSPKPWYVHTRQRGFDAWLDQKVDSTDPTNPDPKDAELFSVSKTTNAAMQPTFAKNPWRPCSPWEKDGSGSWVVRPPQPVTTPAIGTSTAHFKQNLYTWPGDTEPYTTSDAVPGHSLGWCNLSQGRRMTSPEVPADYAGVAANPLPWIAWKDGPMASPFELLVVPRTSAVRLLTDYRDVGSLTDADGTYDDAYGDKPFGVDEDQPFGATRPGHHLLPLTSITDRPSDPSTWPLPPANPGSPVADALSKVFGYVRTPSPFAGTRTVIDGTAPGTPAFFRPPFNVLETYREPGRININTIRDETIWKAIIGDEGGVGLSPLWNVVGTGRGPWRTTTGARRPASGARRQNTLLADRSPGGGLPLMPTPEIHYIDENGEEQVRPLPPAFSPERSPWFRFAPLIRAAANTTTRSEVYAIWVTIGLFEVEQVVDQEGKPDRGVILAGPPGVPKLERYPAAYKITREYGTATGDVERYRGFYIFDRSRAITYEMGADHNIDDAILVERFIE